MPGSVYGNRVATLARASTHPNDTARLVKSWAAPWVDSQSKRKHVSDSHLATKLGGKSVRRLKRRCGPPLTYEAATVVRPCTAFRRRSTRYCLRRSQAGQAGWSMTDLRFANSTENLSEAEVEVAPRAGVPWLSNIKWLQWPTSLSAGFGAKRHFRALANPRKAVPADARQSPIMFRVLPEGVPIPRKGAGHKPIPNRWATSSLGAPAAARKITNRNAS
jgi:hypothetical protein